jgi:hypothetical protein
MFRLLCFTIIRLLHYLLDAYMCKTISCDTLVIPRESVGMICIISKLIVICYLHVFLHSLRPIYIYIYLTPIVCKLFCGPFCYTACTVLFFFSLIPPPPSPPLSLASVKGFSCVPGSCCGIHDFRG